MDVDITQKALYHTFGICTDVFLTQDITVAGNTIDFANQSLRSILIKTQGFPGSCLSESRCVPLILNWSLEINLQIEWSPRFGDYVTRFSHLPRAEPLRKYVVNKEDRKSLTFKPYVPADQQVSVKLETAVQIKLAVKQ